MASETPPSKSQKEQQQQLQQSIYAKLLDVTRSSSSIAARDIPFCSTVDQDFARSIEKTSHNLLTSLNALLKTADPSGNIVDQDIDTSEDVDTNWNRISEVVDTLFERTDIIVDNLNGKRRQPDIPVDQNAKSSRRARFEQLSSELAHASHIKRPQLSFTTAVDNSEGVIFKPLLKEKPFAIEPLEKSLVLQHPPSDDIINRQPYYCQPYAKEIMSQDYPSEVFKIRQPLDPQPWETTTAEWIDNQPSLNKMIDSLKTYKEVAFDLEHHDYRSFNGFVCLMQISTRTQDYIVDTLALRDELRILNQITTDPSILKVFHGGYMDIMWLQRDFGVYVVSMFDTYHASRSLGLKHHSLAFLLEKYANFETSKKYQLADWRVRPLPKEMFDYARSDTHFLLYIYDQLRNELLSQATKNIPDKMRHVLKECRNTAVLRYEHAVYEAESGLGKGGWLGLVKRYSLSVAELQILKVLHRWRYTVARQQDESERFVMSNQVLIALCRNMPTERSGVLGVAGKISDIVRTNSIEIAALIKATKERAAHQKNDDQVEDKVLEAVNITAADGDLDEEESELSTTPNEDNNEVTTRSQDSSPSQIQHMMDARLMACKHIFFDDQGSDYYYPTKLSNNDSNLLGSSINGLTDESIANIIPSYLNHDLTLYVPVPPLDANVVVVDEEPIEQEQSNEEEKDPKGGVFVLQQHQYQGGRKSNKQALEQREQNEHEIDDLIKESIGEVVTSQENGQEEGTTRNVIQANKKQSKKRKRTNKKKDGMATSLEERPANEDGTPIDYDLESKKLGLFDPKGKNRDLAANNSKRPAFSPYEQTIEGVGGAKRKTVNRQGGRSLSYVPKPR